jgi:putative tryptophan/tyrosine transport system substrate-binding protein
MTARLKRRVFITGLGSAVARPVVARGQETPKVRRVGYLTPSSIADKAGVAVFDAFRLKLQDLGYVEGKNLALDVRRAEGDYARVPALADEVVSSTPDVIVGISANVVAALHRATSSIPIVMGISGDPVASGFVKSLAEPGGNITGVYNQSLELTAKSIELLHEAVPNAKRIAILRSSNVGHESMVKEANTGAGKLGLVVVPVMARTPADLSEAFGTMHQSNCDALIVLADPRLDRKIVELADQWRLPALYQYTEFVNMGGLLSYSVDLTEQFRLIALFVARILKNARPAELPVEQPTNFRLTINLKTAKALGLDISPSLLARADEVIE